MSDYLSDGRVVGGLRVKELVTAAPTLGASLYRAVCTRCGGHHLLTHKRLLDRERKQHKRCGICEHKEPDAVQDRVEESRHLVDLACARSEPDLLTRFPLTVPHVRAADRSVWPSLGRMGPRYG